MSDQQVLVQVMYSIWSIEGENISQRLTGWGKSRAECTLNNSNHYGVATNFIDWNLCVAFTKPTTSTATTGAIVAGR